MPWTTISFLRCGALFFILTLFGEVSLAQTGKVLTDQEIRTRDYMIEITNQLGVTCTYCHDLKDFKKVHNKAYSISKTHIDLVKMLNEKHQGQFVRKVDCYMCHKGQAKFK